MIEAKELFSLLSSSTLFDKVIFLEVFASNTKYLRQKLKTFFDTVIISVHKITSRNLFFYNLNVKNC